MRGSELHLHMQSGIPVVEVKGLLIPDLVRQVCSTLSRLIQAGHFDLVLNLRQAACEGAEFTRALMPIAAEARRKHGHVQVVAGGDLHGHLSSMGATDLFRLAESESEAIRRLKRLPAYSLWSESQVGKSCPSGQTSVLA